MKQLLWATSLTALIIAAPAYAQWSYKITRDPMADKPKAFATARSLNTHAFQFPYQGGTRAFLEVRNQESDGLSAYFYIDRGQFACGLECKIQIRFDDEEPYSVTVNRAGDGSTDVVFIESAQWFVDQARQAKRVRVAADFFRHGTLIYEFRTAGLQWPPDLAAQKSKRAKP